MAGVVVARRDEASAKNYEAFEQVWQRKERGSPRLFVAQHNKRFR